MGLTGLIIQLARKGGGQGMSSVRSVSSAVAIFVAFFVTLVD